MDRWGLYQSGTKVTDAPATLFERKKEEDVMVEVEKIEAAQRAQYEAQQAKDAAASEANADVQTADTDAEDDGMSEEILENGDCAADTKIATPEAKPEITFEDFDKVELRIGKILHAEEVPKSKKLLKLSVQVGAETRTILSGIKKTYKPEDLVGKRVMIVANLAPRKIAGEESQGMIVAAEDNDGNIALMTPMAKMPSGCLIG